MIDLELFKKRYSVDKATYKELKKEFGGISFSTINAYRVRLGLPKREKSFDRFEVDKSRFRELYESRDPYYTYEEIAAELGCSTSLIVILRRRLNLPDREPKPRLVIDEDKFRQMYLAGNSYDHICEEFGICVFTIQKLRKKFNLPNRKQKSSYEEKSFIESYMLGLSNHKLAAMFGMERKTVAQRIKELNLPQRKRSVLYNETDFREAYNDGLTTCELAEKFNISIHTVYWHIKDLGLSGSRVNKKTTVVEPLMNPPEPARIGKSMKFNDTSEPATTEPVKLAEVSKPVTIEKTPEIQPIYKNHMATFSTPPRTLKEIQKLQLQKEITRAEREYKITHKEAGFGSLINEEIDNPINLTFR